MRFARSPAILSLVAAGAVAAPPAEAKISIPLGGRTLVAGQAVQLRVPGCSSSKPCRWASGTVVLLTRPAPGVPPRHGLLQLGVVGRFGMLRLTIPRNARGEYQLVASWPRFGGTRTWASTPFHVTG